jgi:oligopeptidase A
VLSADAYAAFEEAGNPFDAATGKRFLDEILSSRRLTPGD